MIYDLLAPPKRKPFRDKGTGQSYALRDVCFKLVTELEAIQATTPEEKCDRARAVTALVKAWSESDERIRIHRGKPLPGTLRPTRQGKSREPRAIPDPVALPKPPAVEDPLVPVTPPAPVAESPAGL